MARPKSALRKRLEEIAAARAAEAEAAATSSSSPSYTNTDSAVTPASSVTTADGNEEERLRISLKLERISSIGPQQVNARNWDFSTPEWKEALEYLSPNFAAYWDNYPRALSFEENIMGSREQADQDVNFKMEIEEVSSDVDEVKGMANVYMHLRVSGTNVTMQGLSNLCWERDERGKWWCVRHDGFRSMNAGFD